jgi:hypothetical protein
MLLHLIPRLDVDGFVHDQVHFVDLTIAELGLTLLGQEHLTVCRPYPNKTIYTVCRRGASRKALCGILVQADSPIQRFTMVARWSVDARIRTHRVTYVIVDQKFSAISDDMTLWEAPWPDHYGPHATPANSSPRMSLMPKAHPRQVFDVVDHFGRVQERREIFIAQTLDPNRLWDPRTLHVERMPAPEDAFHALPLGTTTQS